jgi:GST-like protein
MAAYPWTVNWQGQDQNLAEFPYFKRWFEELSERPAVKRGLAVGQEFVANETNLTKEESERRAKLLYNQRARPVPQS